MEKKGKPKGGPAQVSQPAPKREVSSAGPDKEELARTMRHVLLLEGRRCTPDEAEALNVKYMEVANQILSGPKVQAALDEFAKKRACPSETVSESDGFDEEVDEDESPVMHNSPELMRACHAFMRNLVIMEEGCHRKLVRASEEFVELCGLRKVKPDTVLHFALIDVCEDFADSGNTRVVLQNGTSITYSEDELVRAMRISRLLMELGDPPNSFFELIKSENAFEVIRRKILAPE